MRQHSPGKISEAPGILQVADKSHRCHSERKSAVVLGLRSLA